MITPAQIRDLNHGDVVEIADASGATIRGPLRRLGPADSRGLTLGSSGIVVRRSDGCLAGQWADNAWYLTVVSRAPRPLYVNHPRTEPVPGDVVRDADDERGEVWMGTENVALEKYAWWYGVRSGFTQPEALPKRLTLLVDGETGQAVAS